MISMNFDLAHKQMAAHAGGPSRRHRPRPCKATHRPSIALILLATAVQVIAMAAVLLGTVAAASLH